MSDDLQRASGLWLKDGKNGKKYFSGQVSAAIPEGAKILIFKNDRKDNEKSPDYSLFYVVESEQPPMRRAEPNRGAENQQHDAAPIVDESDIPF